MKYTVHLYAIVRVTVRNIEAESQRAAIQRAEDSTNLYELFDRPNMEYAEDMDSFHVDEEGDEEFARSRWYDKHGNPLKGSTT